MIRDKDIPEDWSWKKLGEICEIIGGKPNPKGKSPFEGGRIPFVRMKDLGKYHITSNLCETEYLLNPQYAHENNFRIIKKGSILIPRSGSVALNHRAVLDVDACIVSHICALELIDSDVNNLYLYYVLRQIDMRKYMKKTTGLDLITFNDLRKINIPFPPVETQKKIVTVLEKAEQLKQWRQKSDKLTNDYLCSTFLELFGDPVKNPKDFDFIKLKTVFSKNKSGTKCGPFGSALKKHEYVDDGIPVWTMNNVQDNKFVEEGCLFIEESKYHLLKSYSVENGDILISRAGTVGKMCIVNTSYQKSIIHSNLIRLSLDQSKIQPAYFTSLMSYCKNRISRLKTGADGAYTFMNTGILNNLEIPLPPISLQDKFVQIIKNVEKLKKSQKESKYNLDNFFNILIQKAFRGELIC